MGFLKRVYRVIDTSDVVLEVLDARFASEMRNTHIEEKIIQKRKKLGIILNKSDLVTKSQLKKKIEEIAKTHFVIATTTKERKTKAMLKKIIGTLSKGRKSTIGFIGYPNTGKSTLINILAGRKCAKTSPSAGYTRGEQKIRVNQNITAIDTPGIIPLNELEEEKLILFGAKNPQQAKNIEMCAEYLLEYLRKNDEKKMHELLELEESQNIKNKETETLLEEYAEKKGKMLKEKKPDTKNAAKILCTKWFRGK
jgi:ribosome biogenesis GTPase A